MDSLPNKAKTASLFRLQREKHVKFFERILNGLPANYAAQETNFPLDFLVDWIRGCDVAVSYPYHHTECSINSFRQILTLIYFCVSGLDLLEVAQVLQKFRAKLSTFIKSLSCQSFPGGFVGNANDANCDLDSDVLFVGPSAAMTFAALNCLVVLGDDLSGCDRDGITRMLKTLQTPEGCFCGTAPLGSRTRPLRFETQESEADMRFVYCACVISFLLEDWSGIDIPRMLSFIWRSQSYEGGFGQTPGTECHGGSTYCAVASLFLVHLANQDSLLKDVNDDELSKLAGLFDSADTSSCDHSSRDRLVRWCVMRQLRGFSGRPNKPEDSCYTFWIGSTLKLLDAYDFVDELALQEFCGETQDPIVGGFSKWPNIRSDPLHSFLCLAGLSLCGAALQRSGETSGGSLLPVFPALNISMAAYKRHRSRTSKAVATFENFDDLLPD